MRIFQSRIAVSGGLSGLLSMVALARRSRMDSGSGYDALNAPSHWLYGEEAFSKHRFIWRFTAGGFIIHHAAACFWAFFYDRLLRVIRARRDPAKIVVATTVLTAIAALIDLKVVPRRLSPGFEHQLSSKSLMWVYGAFGAGLLLGHVVHALDKDSFGPMD